MIDSSEQVVYIHWHFIDFSGVELLDVSKDTHIFISNKVYRHTSPIETSRPTNPMDVELTRLGQVKADHQTNLLYIESSPPDIGSDQYTALA